MLRQRLAELKAAEQHQREQQELIAAQMRIEKSQQKEPPKLSERDLEFLGARPNIQSDPEFVHVAQTLPGYGSDKYYKALALFPIEDYRTVDQLPYQNEQQATEPSPQQLEEPPQPQIQRGGQS